MRNGRVLLAGEGRGADVRDAALNASWKVASDSGVDSGVAALFAVTGIDGVSLRVASPFPMSVAGVRHYARAICEVRTAGGEFGPLARPGETVWALGAAFWAGATSRDFQPYADYQPGMFVQVGLTDFSAVSGFAEGRGDQPAVVGSSAALMRSFHHIEPLPFKGDVEGLFQAVRQSSQGVYSHADLALVLTALTYRDPVSMASQLSTLSDSGELIFA